MKITLDREMVTPKQAALYLESFGPNRPLNQKRVRQLADAILRGEWHENGETAKFNGDGSGMDGQHRFAAIVLAKKAAPMWIARGLPSEAMETVDIGSTRTIGNMLAIRGYTNANGLSAAARMVWTYRKYGELGHSSLVSRALNPTPSQLIELVETEPVLEEWVRFGRRIAKADPALKLSPATIAGAAFVFADVSRDEDAQEFFAQLLNPKYAHDPTTLLRKTLLKQGFHTPMHPRMRIALLVKAWNAWIIGDRPKLLRWKPGGAHPEEFPAVVGLHKDDLDATDS